MTWLPLLDKYELPMNRKFNTSSSIHTNFLYTLNIHSQFVIKMGLDVKTIVITSKHVTHVKSINKAGFYIIEKYLFSYRDIIFHNL